MTKLATLGNSVPALIGDLLFVVSLWSICATGIGWLLASWKGHGGIVLLFSAWLLGLLGLVTHLFVLVRRWRGGSSSKNTVESDACPSL